MKDYSTCVFSKNWDSRFVPVAAWGILSLSFSAARYQARFQPIR